MGDIYGTIDDYNPNKKSIGCIENMNSDMFSSKKLQLIVTELFMRSSKLKIPLVFNSQSYFAVSKNKFYILHLHGSSKQTKNFNKKELIIHQILTLKAL